MTRLISIIIGLLILAVLVYFGLYFYTMRGVKVPNYKVLSSHHSIQVRQYPELIIAEVNVSGNRNEAANKGFRMLANYIFGDNRIPGQDKNEKIAMTAPVIQQSSQKIAMTAPVVQQSTADQQWQVRFIMPAKFTLQTLPKPNNRNILIVQQPARKVIAIRFSGRLTNESFQKHLKTLQEYIAKNDIKVQGQPIFAYYNPPWTLPFMRRNEIVYAIQD